MTVQSNFPSSKPSLLLDFANVKALDPRITFTRTTTATYHDGKTTAKAEENVQTQSQSFTAQSGSTVTNNNAVAPNGASTAATFIEDGSTGIHAAQSNSITYAAATYTFSFFAKPNGRSWIALRQGGTTRAWFDVTNGAVGTTSAGVTASIVASAGSYYRCVATFTTAAGAANIFFRLGDADNSDSYAGDGTSGIDIWGIQVEQRSAVTAYTPTTTQAITNYIPVLQTAASGVARFDHNPTTGESLGLLVEEQRTNLYTYSDDFDNAAWTKTRSSITSNTIVAPDGTLTGDKLVEDTTASNNHFIRIASLSVTSGTTYTWSVFAKAAENNQIALWFGSDNSAFSASVVVFTLTGNGSLSVTSGSATGTITPVGNGWYRCTATNAATASASAFLRTALTDDSNSLTFTGDGYSGIYIWGAQLEAGAFPTSYIATTTASVTRNADAASMTGTNFSSWYRADEGALYSEASVNNASTAVSIAAINDNTYQNMLRFFYRAINLSGVQLTNGNVTQADLTPTGSLSANQPFKLVAAYKVNDIASSVNAGTVATDTSATIPVVNQMAIGFASTGAPAYTNGHIRKLAYYPARLSNAQLQALTT